MDQWIESLIKCRQITNKGALSIYGYIFFRGKDFEIRNVAWVLEHFHIYRHLDNWN